MQGNSTKPIGLHSKQVTLHVHEFADSASQVCMCMYSSQLHADHRPKGAYCTSIRTGNAAVVTVAFFSTISYIPYLYNYINILCD